MSIPILLAANPLLESAKATGDAFGFTWLQFLSNCISFVIVCILLQKFAYKPIVTVLELRREKIAESLKNAERIKAELADAERKKSDILTAADAEAQRMIEEARASASAVAEKRTQQAIAEAEQIVAKAHEAARIEHDRMLSDLKREVGQLVIATTGRVTGKILTTDDQRRINEETASQIAA
ncbi:MAG TPA: F0F1 ATP synthase subunit B [Chthoniobacteraceae bacterium]|jgi:F-type H+-transporting ATPase subunit b|nr:F0F1 ATP synthase subunit B [Chthoniobacteraceae bacterium]